MSKAWFCITARMPPVVLGTRSECSQALVSHRQHAIITGQLWSVGEAGLRLLLHGRYERGSTTLVIGVGCG